MSTQPPQPQQVQQSSQAVPSTSSTRPPARSACLSCRQTKVKCLPVSEESGPLDICTRCVRLESECLYGQQKRGRKAGGNQKRAAETSEPHQPRPSPYIRANIPTDSHKIDSEPDQETHHSNLSQVPNASQSSSSTSLSALYHDPQNASGSSYLQSYSRSSAPLKYIISQPQTGSYSPGRTDASYDPRQQIIPPEHLYNQHQTFEDVHPHIRPQHQFHTTSIPIPYNPQFPVIDSRQPSSGFPQPHLQKSPAQAYCPQQQQASHSPHLYQQDSPHTHERQHQTLDLRHPNESSSPRPFQYPTSQNSVLLADTGQNTQQSNTRTSAQSAIRPSSRSPPAPSSSSSSRPEASSSKTPTAPTSFPSSSSAPPLSLDAHSKYLASDTIYPPSTSFLRSERTTYLPTSISSDRYHLSSHPPQPPTFHSLQALLNDASASGIDSAQPHLPQPSTLADSASGPLSSSLEKEDAGAVLSVAEVFKQAGKHVLRGSNGQREREQALGNVIENGSFQRRASQDRGDESMSTDNMPESTGGGGPERIRKEGGKRTREGKRRASFEVSARKTSRGWEDPLGTGLVDEVQVEALFGFYHTRLNVFADILDPALHTSSYTRSRSPILFTCILAAAAKILLPQIYPALLTLSNQMFGRAFFEGVVEIGLIQGLEIMSFWKEAGETGSWRRSGYAIRLAYELDLHKDHIRPLPSEEIAAREVLDGERCWFQLICFDTVQALQHGRPKMIAEAYHKDVLAWSMDHPLYPCYSDSMLAASTGFLHLTGFAAQILKTTEPSLQEMLLEKQKEAFRVWRRDWTDSSADPNRFHPDCKIMLDFYCRHFAHKIDVLELTVLRPSRLDNPFSPTQSAADDLRYAWTFTRTVGSALEVLKFFTEEVGPFLNLGQDILLFGTSAAALFLAKNIHRVSESVFKTIFATIKAAHAVCLACIQEPGDHTTFQAKFFESILYAASSSLPLRPETPRGDGNDADAGPVNGDEGEERPAADEARSFAAPAELAGPLMEAGPTPDPSAATGNGLADVGWPFEGAVVDESISLEDLFADYMSNGDFPFDIFQLS